MFISRFGYGSVSDPRGNSIMLCCSYASCLWRINYDCIIVASNSLLLFANRHVVWMFVLQIQYICRWYYVLCSSHLQSTCFVSAVAWISLSFFPIGHILVVLICDLWYVVHIAISSLSLPMVGARGQKCLNLIILHCWRRHLRHFQVIFKNTYIYIEHSQK